jgi:hypothetical protein
VVSLRFAALRRVAPAALDLGLWAIVYGVFLKRRSAARAVLGPPVAPSVGIFKNVDTSRGPVPRLRRAPVP